MFEPNDRILTGFPTSLHFCRSRKAILRREMKDLTLALKLCAFSLATVLVRHISTEKNLKEYFNSEELAIEVKDLENGASEQYLVDPKALVRLNTRCHLLAFAAKVEKKLQATVSIQ